MLLVGIFASTIGLIAVPGSGAQSPALPYSEDFEGSVGGEWSPQATAIAPNGQKFLGQLGEQTVTLSLPDLPEHSSLRISLDLHIIGTMDGSSTVSEGSFTHGPDVFTLSLDGAATPLKTTTFSNVKDDDDYRQAYPGDHPGALNPAGTGASATDALGYPPDDGDGSGFFGDTTYHLEFVAPHSASSMTLAIAASGVLDPGHTFAEDESWGIDNVVITQGPGSECFDPAAGVMVGHARACGPTLSPVAPGSKVYSTTDTAWVGGFEIRPRAGGTLVVDTETVALRADGAGVDVIFAGVVVPVPLEAIPVGLTAGEFEFNTAGTLERNLFDLPVSGKAKVAWAAGGSAATFEMEVDLVKLTADWGTPSQPSTSGSVDGSGAKLSARLQNGRGFILEGAEVKASEIAIVPRVLQVQRTLALKDVLLKYALVGGKHTFQGQAGIRLPFLKGEITATGRASVFDGDLAGGGLTVSGINQPIPSTPLFLKSVEGDLQFIPSFGFNLGLAATLGPQVAGTELTEISANARGLALATGCTLGQDPIELALVAKVTPIEQAGLGKATLTGTACIYVTSQVLEGRFQAEAALGGGLFPELMGYSGTVNGWISSSAANYEGTGTVRLPGLPDVTGKEILSTKGIGACAEFSPFFAGGFAYAWGGAAPTAFTGCDVSPWRETLQPSASASPSRRTAVVRRRLPFAGFSVEGSSGPPRVRVVGPAGERYRSPAGGNLLKTRSVLIAQIPTENRTYIFVRRPTRGRWRIEGDRPITELRSADGLAKPRVTGKVRRVRPASRGTRPYVLRYRIRPVRGQRVEFFERADGVARRLGRATRRRRGKVRFAALAASDRTHIIEATVTQNGFPRDRSIVARFRVR